MAQASMYLTSLTSIFMQVHRELNLHITYIHALIYIPLQIDATLLLLHIIQAYQTLNTNMKVII